MRTLMHRFACSAAFAWLLSIGMGTAGAQVIVPNGSFEAGDGSPASWTLSRPPGERITGGAEGEHAISVSGDGQSDNANAWLSEPLRFEPNTVYRLRFQARRLPGTGGSAVSGSAVSGPVFCNRDLGSLTDDWAAVESFFVTPQQLSDDVARLRFGQWQFNGSVAFDDVHVERVIPVYQTLGHLQLGEGERLEGNRYTFAAPLGQASASQSHPLVGHQCSFNSNRWVLGEEASVTYRHHIDRPQLQATVQATVGWYLRGELIVSASRDGKEWQTLGTLGKEGSLACEVPQAMLPADEIWIRFTARAAAGETQPPALQLHGYHYEARVDGPPREILGTTRFVAVLESDPQLQVGLAGVGDAIPGGDNRVSLHLHSQTDKRLQLSACVETQRLSAVEEMAATAADRRRAEDHITISLDANVDQTVQIPYTLAGVGRHRVTVQISGDARFTAETTFDVPALHAADYGQTLPASDAAVGLWWCSSGWKVGSQRPVPASGAPGAAIRITAAGNEAEAAQLVVRPSKTLSNFRATAGELTGPASAKIESRQIEILRVGYVRVTQPTDASSTVGLWPDPLPPCTQPLTLEAERNAPLWVRVHVPHSQPRGTYHGTITLQADQYRAEIPLHVDVFGFSLPDRMTCQTAFGFDVGEVWRYHGLKTEEHRRLVLDKYLQCLADHHISPYEPAPLDPIRVTWKNAASGTEQANGNGLESHASPIPEPVFDFSAWDQAMRRAIDVYHFNSFRLNVPGLGGGTFHERYEPQLLGYAEHTPQYEGAMRAFLGALEAHLREQGWLEEAFVYWFDEPDPKDYAFVNNGFAKLKKWAPDLRRMLTEQVEPDLVDGPNIWCPLTPSFDPQLAQQRREKGDAFWWYVCTGPKAPYCTLFIDHPATELRVWLWQTWQRSISGVLVWDTNYWTSSAAYPDPAYPQNPYEDPMGWVSGYSTPDGVRQAWGNGDGRFLYPPESAADGRPSAPVLEGPVDSIRLEMLRDGLEDYEYFTILKRLLEARRDTLTAQQRTQFTSLLEVPDTVTANLTTFTTDPAPLEERREVLARAIEQLSP
ncbi:MAG: DUF4091 domain-containing protein [Pirellulaceae bacterium]